MIKRVPNIVTVLTFTLITLLFWIAFSAYRLIVEPAEIIEVPQDILTPLDPGLNQQTLNEVSQRLYLDENEVRSYIEDYEQRVNVATPAPESQSQFEVPEDNQPLPTGTGLFNNEDNQVNQENELPILN